MKRLLLDTEALIWWDADRPVLGAHARAVIRNAEEVYVSAASAWEIVIKEALGKLRTTRTLLDAVLEGGFRPLPVTFEHVQGVTLLPRHHTDPFDRLIIAAARVEGLAVVTSDPKFRAYDVPLVEARE